MATPQQEPAVRISGVTRNYGGLRPLRLASLSVAPGERVALAGIDTGAAEVLINLITGAALPDQGDVHVFGKSTAGIASGDEWLQLLERFGIVSPRAVLIEGATVEQNLAMPFTLEIEPVPLPVVERVRALAEECGISTAASGWLQRVAGDVPGDVRTRVHLARAVALDPQLLLIEHPTAGVDVSARPALAADVRGAIEKRGLTAIVITQDLAFAAAVAQRTLELQPASGELKPRRRGWFSS